MKTALVWFTNDLRVDDQSSLSAAIKENDRVIAAYVIDPAVTKHTSYGFKKMGSFRAQFLLESLTDLAAQLFEIGIEFHVFFESAEVCLPGLILNQNCSTIYKLYQWTTEELQQEEQVKTHINASIKWKYSYDQFLIPITEFPYPSIDQLPEVFTSFRKKIEKSVTIPFSTKLSVAQTHKSTVRHSIPTLESIGYKQPQINPTTAFPYRGGFTSALEHLKKYIWEDQHIKTYKYTRNQLIGTSYSTKFSPWLSNGSISARQLYTEVKAFEQRYGASQHTYWIIFELLWRDYFKYVSLKYKSKIFTTNGINGREFTHRFNPELFHQWCRGETSDDFVNANMIELHQTGWMSNRGRQNVASFLVHHLHNDWLSGAAYFESQLLDYDVDSNYGNWMYVAGVGNDPRNRIFNTRLQAQHYDPQGKYRSLWLQKKLF